MSRLLTAAFLTSAARTANGQQEINLSNDFNNMSVLVNVTAVSGTTPTLRFHLEDSLDGTTWFPIQSSTADITAAGTFRLFFDLGTAGATAPRTRLRWVIAGTTPSFTFAATAITRARAQK